MLWPPRREEPAASGRLRLAIVTNEVFEPSLGRIGGFGWAAREVCRSFAEDAALGVDPVLLVGEHPGSGLLPETVHGAPVVWRSRLRPWARDVRRQAPDLMLWIDYRPSYRFFFAALPRTPVLVWSRDPWAGADRALARTIAPDAAWPAVPTAEIPTRQLRSLAHASRTLGRAFDVVVTTAWLRPKLAEAYGVDGRAAHVVPNPLPHTEGPLPRATRPTVAFLGRLDPVKRPWLVFELAERCPEIEFLVMGRRHLGGAHEHRPVPPNVRLLGHVDARAKHETLQSAWLLVNTSVHEGLAISFLEALATETPLVATVDPDRVVSRFGTFVGEHAGDGRSALPALEAAVRVLLEDDHRRTMLGREGRAWVEAAHSRDAFLRGFSEAADRLHVTWSAA